MLKLTGAAVAGSTIFGIDAIASDKPSGATASTQGNKPKKALVIGAHPDDPESCCGGTMVMLRKAGWDVVSVYMTKGEAGIKGKSHEESSAIRVKEATEACKLLDVRPVFLTQIDGSCIVDADRYKEMRDFIDSEKPDVVFTHWPMDSHADHRVCYTLVFDAWRRLGYCFDLYFFEAMNGIQSQLFYPTDWVDITPAAETKRKATFCHVSQQPENWYDESHGQMELFRGLEYRCKRAEGFVYMNRTGKIF
jgi:LmbE family N-acetylglucosaminyl deacetylase